MIGTVTLGFSVVANSSCGLLKNINTRRVYARAGCEQGKPHPQKLFSGRRGKSPLQLPWDALPCGNGIARNCWDPGRIGIASLGVGTKVDFPEKLEVVFVFCRLQGESKR